MDKKKAKRFIAYLFRWQLSTPILAPCIYFLSGSLGTMGATIMANLIGGIIFYYVDKQIFK